MNNIIHSTVSSGSIGDLFSTGLFLLAISAITLTFIRCAAIINTDSEVSQLARKYILRMESAGYLTQEDQLQLLAELELLDLDAIDITGTTLSPPGYGSTITLRINARTEGGYAVNELRQSTAKY